MLALINSNSQIDFIINRYNFKLGLKVFFTNIQAEKIDSFIFQIFKIVYTSFQIKEKLD